MLGFNSLQRNLLRVAAAHLLLAFAPLCSGAFLDADIVMPSANHKKPTAEEWAAIPAFCPIAMSFSTRGFIGGPSPKAKPWENKMGRAFWGSHHYCWAEISVMRALRHNTSRQEKQGLLSSAVADYWFVVNNSQNDFILLPQIFTRIGETELRLSHPQQANQAFAQARALKPDYWPAYTHWAEFLIKTDNRAEAKRLVKEGLEYSPNSKLLREQYRVLGGNPSDIVRKTLPNHQEIATENTPDETVDHLLTEESGSSTAEPPAR